MEESDIAEGPEENRVDIEIFDDIVGKLWGYTKETSSSHQAQQLEGLPKPDKPIGNAPVEGAMVTKHETVFTGAQGSNVEDPNLPLQCKQTSPILQSELGTSGMRGRHSSQENVSYSGHSTEENVSYSGRSTEENVTYSRHSTEENVSYSGYREPGTSGMRAGRGEHSTEENVSYSGRSTEENVSYSGRRTEENVSYSGYRTEEKVSYSGCRELGTSGMRAGRGEHSTEENVSYSGRSTEENVSYSGRSTEENVSYSGHRTEENVSYGGCREPGTSGMRGRHSSEENVSYSEHSTEENVSSSGCREPGTSGMRGRHSSEENVSYSGRRTEEIVSYSGYSEPGTSGMSAGRGRHSTEADVSYSGRSTEENVSYSGHSTEENVSYSGCSEPGTSGMSAGRGRHSTEGTTSSDNVSYSGLGPSSSPLVPVIRYQLMYHVNKHSPKEKYVCPTCNKSFKERTNIEEHMRTAHKSPAYYCLICRGGFWKIKSVISHCKKFHPVDDWEYTDATEKMVRQAASSREVLYSDVQDPDVHREDQGDCEITPPRHFNVSKKIYQCAICHAEETSIFDMEFHIKTIHRKCPYVCKKCGKEFSTRKGYTVHKKTH